MQCETGLEDFSGVRPRHGPRRPTRGIRKLIMAFSSSRCSFEYAVKRFEAAPLAGSRVLCRLVQVLLRANRLTAPLIDGVISTKCCQEHITSRAVKGKDY